MIEKTPEVALREYCLIYLQMVYEYLSTRQSDVAMTFATYQQTHRLMDRYSELYKVVNLKYDDPSINHYLVHKYYNLDVDLDVDDD